MSLAKADDGTIELALDGGHVTQQRLETFSVSVADEEFEGAGFEDGGFVAAGSLETPKACGDFGYDLGFERPDGRVLGEELIMKTVEIGLIFAAKDHRFSGEAVLETIPARDGLAGFGARAGSGVAGG